jgi:methionine aminopeptidase
MNSLYNAVTIILKKKNKKKEKKRKPSLSCLPHVFVTLTQAGNKAVGVMKAGQTFTIEPMINAGILQIV